MVSALKSAQMLASIFYSGWFLGSPVFLASSLAGCVLVWPFRCAWALLDVSSSSYRDTSPIDGSLI